MSLRAQMWVWERDLPPNAKLVLLAFADHAHDNGREARPTIALVARKTGFSSRQVQRIVSECVRHGALILERHASSSTPNVYRLPVDTPLAIGRDDWNMRGASPELRAAVIEAFGQVCVHCKGAGDSENGPDGFTWEVDRLVAGRNGGGYKTGNVVLSCRSCNRRKDAKQGRHDDAPGGDADDASPGDVDDAPGGDAGDAQTIPRTIPRTVSNPLLDEASSDPEPVPSFEAFWRTYPRRVGKQAAVKAWARSVKSAAPAVIIAAAARYRDDPNRDPAFTAHPTTWLNQGRWDDDPLPARPGHSAYVDPVPGDYASGWMTDDDLDEGATGT